MPLFSIVVPIYNKEEYIDRCCNSLSNQTFRDIEILLIDDGSTDNSKDICTQWILKDERIKYYYKNNGGLGDARNYGIQKATGKYLAFCDPDDWFDFRCCERVQQLICKYNPDIIGFGYYKCIDGIPKNKKISYIEEGIYKNPEDTILPDFISKKYLFCYDDKPVIKSVCMHMYRKNMLTDNNIHFLSERDIGSEDYLFNIEAIIKADSYYSMQYPFYYYDTVEGSLSRQHRADLYKREKILYENYCRVLHENDISSEKIKKRLQLFYIQSMYTCICNTCQKVSKLSYLDAVHEIKEVYKDKTLNSYLKNNRTCAKSAKSKALVRIMRLRNATITYLAYKLFVKK